MRERIEDFLLATYKLHTPGAAQRQALKIATVTLLLRESQMEKWAQTLFFQTVEKLQPMIDYSAPTGSHNIIIKDLMLNAENSLYHIVQVRPTDMEPANDLYVWRLNNSELEFVDIFQRAPGMIYIGIGVGEINDRESARFRIPLQDLEQINNLSNTIAFMPDTFSRANILLKMDQELNLIYARNTIRELQQRQKLPVDTFEF